MLASGAAAAGSPARPGQPPSADTAAHRQGQVLILSERLGRATALFDRLRSLRYQQLTQQEAARRRRLPQASPGGGAPQTSAELHQRLQRGAAATAAEQQQQQPWKPGAPAGGGAQWQQQTQVDAENQALQLELLGMNDQARGRGVRCWSGDQNAGLPGTPSLPQTASLQPLLPSHAALGCPPMRIPCVQVQHAERTVREIAALNQMFSTAIAHQSEQIEKLYRWAAGYCTECLLQAARCQGPSDPQCRCCRCCALPTCSEAVEATHNISRANVQVSSGPQGCRAALCACFVRPATASLAAAASFAASSAPKHCARIPSSSTSHPPPLLPRSPAARSWTRRSEQTGRGASTCSYFSWWPPWPSSS